MNYRILFFTFIILLGSSRAFIVLRPREIATVCRISSGFSFQNDDQILLSAQKPLGLLLEEQDDASIRVVEMDENGAAAKAGVRMGDILLSVQNASVKDVSLERAMAYIAQAPKVVNLRFARPKL